MKIGIIGCGRIFRHYIDTISTNCSFNISAVYDNKPAVRDIYRDTFHTYDRMEDLTNSDVELVCILTPSGTHYDIAKQCIGAGKNVLVEKPLALRVSDAESLIKIATDHGKRLYCGFQNRFNVAIESAKQVLKQGLIGDIISCHVALEWCRYQDYYNDEWHGRWSMDGGVIAQQAIHHVDSALYLLGTPVRVVGLGRNVSNSLEAEDTFAGLIHLDNHLTVTLSATTAYRPEDRSASIKILGTNGVISIGGIGLNTYSLCAGGYQAESIEDFQNVYGNGHSKLFNAIYKDIRQGTTHPALDLKLSELTTSVISAFYRSWETGSWTTVGTDISAQWGL